jgi:hypothetical protein
VENGSGVIVRSAPIRSISLDSMLMDLWFGLIKNMLGMIAIRSVPLRLASPRLNLHPHTSTLPVSVRVPLRQHASLLLPFTNPTRVPFLSTTYEKVSAP